MGRHLTSNSRRGPGLVITVVLALLVAAFLSIAEARAQDAPREPLGPPIEYAPPEAVQAMAATAAPAVEPAAASSDAQLPFTGARTFGLSVLGVLAFLAGASLVRRRPRRTS